MYTQLGERRFYRFQRQWVENTTEVLFEDTLFSIPASFDKYLTSAYGDYMKLPPEGKRENRHQIQMLDFGE